MDGDGDMCRIGSSDDTLDSFKKVSKKRSLIECPSGRCIQNGV
jgi:hypothetical protein